MAMAVALAFGFAGPVRAGNIAPEGAAILGVNDAVDADAGTPRFQAGDLANVNDGQVATRVDNWFPGDAQAVSFVGVVWPATRYDTLQSLA